MPKPIVLLVEDDADTRELYALVLSDAGFSTVEASNARDALHVATTVRPALIIADLALGAGLDGLELCEKLKHDPATRDIPTLVVTGWSADEKLRARADAVGCAALVMKPGLWERTSGGNPHALRPGAARRYRPRPHRVKSWIRRQTC